MIDCLDEVFSPIRRWDRSQYSGNSTLNSRLLQYYVAKNNIETPGGKDTLENVKAVGREHAQSKYNGISKYMKGKNLSYFEMCLALYSGSDDSSSS